MSDESQESPKTQKTGKILKFGHEAPKFNPIMAMSPNDGNEKRGHEAPPPPKSPDTSGGQTGGSGGGDKSKK